MTTPEPPGGNPYTDPYADPPVAKNPYNGTPYGDPTPAPLPYYNPAGAGAPAPADMPPLGGLGERLVARIIDWVLMIVIGTALATAVVLGSSIDDVYIVAVSLLVASVLGFVYEGLMLSRSAGQTLGKRVMKLRVAVLADGSVPGGAPAWIRSAVYWLPGALTSLCLPLLFSLLNVLWCTWDKPYRQCLHDKAAKTLVVKAD
ncbi:RDD family protein [Streptacidiphilus sp. N1-12]|uniref:RDD family protein n=2 Tax=Streptacidiphilus alkalitolerans TaxID=3342712 RepID=A0ABV6VIG6_9ACTN